MRQNIPDGFVDITQICLDHGKIVNEFRRLPSVKNQIKDLAQRIGVPANALVVTGRGAGQKTFAHPEVACMVKAWCGKTRSKYTHLYVLHCVETRAVKIGITANVEKRVSVIRTACPFDIKLLFSRKVRDAASLESRIHKSLQDYHMRGEWFDEICLQFVDWEAL